MAIATRPKPKTHHKKRQAGHHKQGKQYLKAYWPYMPVAALITSALALQTADTTQQTAGTALGQETVQTGASLLGYQPSNSAIAIAALIVAGALIVYAIRYRRLATK